MRNKLDDRELLDCLVIGGGPAGLTAALYLARFKRRFLVVDSGKARALLIPASHNIPFFAEGIAGPAILARERASAEHYGARILDGTVTALQKRPDAFVAVVDLVKDKPARIQAKRVLLATGALDDTQLGKPRAVSARLLTTSGDTQTASLKVLV